MIYRYVVKLNFSKVMIFNISVIVFFESILLMLEPLFFGKVIDSITKKDTILVKYISLIILVFVGTTILSKIKTLYLIRITSNVEKKVKIDIFSQILKIQYIDYLKIDKGTLLNNIEEDSMIVSNLLNDLIEFFRCLATVIVTLIIMLKINLLLTSIVVIFLPIEFIFFVVMGQILRVKIKDLAYLKDLYINLINESFNGFKTIKAFGVQNDRKKHFIEETDRVYNLGIKKANLDVNISLSISIISFISRIAVIIVGGYLCLGGSLSIGTLVAFNAYAEKFKVEGNGLSSFSSMVQSVGVSLERINALYKEYNLEIEGVGNKFGYQKINTIEVKNLNFSYFKNTPVIDDFSFTFNRGKIYKINGDSGSGKSTFFDILSGLYQEKLIYIKINHESISNASDYRNSIIYIDQNSYIFTQSIYENISIYRSININIIKNICNKLDIDGIIENLPNKYNTIINSETSLSSGQIQRILIARAFVEKKDIYIFDETTAYLDRDNKIRFFKLLKDISNDSIVIFSSHEDLKEVKKEVQIEAIDVYV